MTTVTGWSGARIARTGWLRDGSPQEPSRCSGCFGPHELHHWGGSPEDFCGEQHLRMVTPKREIANASWRSHRWWAENWCKTVRSEYASRTGMSIEVSWINTIINHHQQPSIGRVFLDVFQIFSLERIQDDVGQCGECVWSTVSWEDLWSGWIWWFQTWGSSPHFCWLVRPSLRSKATRSKPSSNKFASLKNDRGQIVRCNVQRPHSLG